MQQLSVDEVNPRPWTFLLFPQGAQGAPRVVQPGPLLGPLDALGRVHHLLLLRPPHLPHRPSLGLQAAQSWSFGERLLMHIFALFHSPFFQTASA